MKNSSLSLRGIGAIVMAMLMVGTGAAWGASVTWDADTGTAGAQDGTGPWDTATANWWNGAANQVWPNTSADEAIFGAGSGTAGSVAVSTVTANKITFNAPGAGTYTLSGGTITLDGATPTIAANANATIASVLAGTVGLTKTGAGTLTLTGANTYSGGTTVSNGILAVGGGGATGSIPTSPLTVASGATLAFNFSTAYTATPLAVAGNLSYTSAAQLGLSGTYGGNQIAATGTNVSVNGALVINAGAGGATITGSSASAAGITSGGTRNITTTGNVTFTGTSGAGPYLDGVSLAGVFTATSGTLTFDGTAGASGAYGFENGVSGSWGAGVSTFGNVTFKGAGGTARNSDLNVGALAGNGNVTLIGTLKGLNTVATFTATGGLPYNVVIQTTAGGINGLLGAGTDTTGNGNYTVTSAANLVLGGRTINAGTGTISLSATTQLNLNATLNGFQITAAGTNVSVDGPLTINAGAGGATITGSSTSAAGITSGTSRNITTTGNVTFTGTSSAGPYLDGISLAGVFTATSGTLTFDGTAGATGAYGFENGVSGSWGAGVSTFGNVTFKGSGGTARNSDLNVGALTGNGNVTLIGRLKGLNTLATFTATGGLPYNVLLQTTAGDINGMLGAGTDSTGGGTYTVTSAGAVVTNGRTINTAGGALSLTSVTGMTLTGSTFNTAGGAIGLTSGAALGMGGSTLNAGAGTINMNPAGALSLNGSFTGSQITGVGTNVSLDGAVTINAGAGGATITGSSASAAGITSGAARNITTTGNVTFTGTSTSTGQYIDGISLAGVYTATGGTLTFDGTAGAGAAYGIECGVSGAWGGSISTFGNVVFKGTGGGGSGGGHDSDLNLGNLTGNGSVTLIGRARGLRINETFTATGGLPYNVVLQTTAGNINGTLGAGTDITANGNYTINSAGSVVFGGRTINAGTGTISLTSASGYSVTANSALQGGTILFNDTQGISLSSGVTLTLNGTGTIPNAISGAGGGLTIAGGAITLTGADTYGGATTVAGGTLRLDFSAAGAPASNILPSGTALTLSGGTLAEQGKASTTNSQTVNGLALPAGSSAINVASGSGGTANLALGAITRTGGSVNFTLPASGSITTTTGNTNGILGTWATVGGTDWAANDGTGKIIAYAAYTDIAALGSTIVDNSTSNVRINFAGSGGNIVLGSPTTTVNTLLQNTATAATVNTAAQILRTGAIQIGSGQQALTIGAAAGDGTLSAAAAGGELVLINNSSNALTINAPIANNTSASPLTTSGTGAVTLKGVNTYTGTTTISGGTLTIGGAGQLGGGSYAGTIVNNANLVYNSTAAQTFTGPLTGGGALTQNGSGTLTINESGTDRFRVGTLAADAASAVTVNGGTLTFQNTYVVFGEGGGGLGQFTQTGGTVNSGSGGVYLSNGTGAPSQMTITGGTFNDNGVLEVGQSGTGTTTLTVNGGSAILNVAGELRIGRNGVQDTMTLNAGTINHSGMYFVVGESAAGGVYNQTGGTFNFTGTSGTYIGNGTSGTGTMTVSGGTFTQTRDIMRVGQNGSSLGILNVGGGADAATVSAPTLTLGTNNVSALGIVNLLANGTLLTGTINRGLGTGTFNFNGGTLQPTASNATFMQGFAAAYVQAGGAVINDAGYSITIAQPLLDGGGGGGLTKLGSGTLTLTGDNTYTGPTTITAGTLTFSTPGVNTYRGGTITIQGPAIMNVVATGGANRYDFQHKTIQWDATGGGTLSLGSTINFVLDTASSGTTTFRTTGGAQDTIIGPGGVNMGNAGHTVNFDIAPGSGGVGLLVSAAMGNGAAMSKSGTGVLALTGANTYSGGTTINAGSITVGNAGAFGTGKLTINASGTVITGIAFNLNSANGNSGLTDLVVTGNAAFANGMTITGGTSNVLGLSIGGNGTLTYSGTVTPYDGRMDLKGSTTTLKLASGSSISLTGTNNNQILFADAGTTLVLDGGSFSCTGNNGVQGAYLGNLIMNSGTASMGGAGSNNVALGANAAVSLNGGTLSVQSISGNATNTVNFNGGTLKALATSGAFLNAAIATKVQAGGIVIDTNGFNDTIAQTLTHDPALGASLDGGLTKNGAGTLTISGGNGGVNGNVTVNAGTLYFNGAANSYPLGMNGARTVTINPGATFTAAEGCHNPFGTLGNVGTLIINGGTYNSPQYNHMNNLIMTGGLIQPTGSQVDGLDMRNSPTVTIHGSATGSTIASKMTLSSPVLFNVEDGAAASDLLMTGAIVGGNSLTKTGAGTMTLSGSGGLFSYSGGTAVNGGVLELKNSGNGSGDGWRSNITLSNNAIVWLTDTSGQTGDLRANITGTGSLVKKDVGIERIGTWSGVPTLDYTGDTTVEAGTLSLQGQASGRGFNTTGNLVINSGAAFEFSGLAAQQSANASRFGALIGAGTLQVAFGTPFIEIGNGDKSGAFSGAITGPLTLTKMGAGTETFSGNSTYTGPTTINGGKLLIDGSITSPVTVNSGGMLGGNGHVTGAVTVNAGGTVSAGDSPGHLTITGNYVQSGTMLAELGGLQQGVTYDWIDVNGTATFNAGSIVDVNAWNNWPSPGEGIPYYVLTATGGITNNDLTGITFDFSGAPGWLGEWKASIVPWPAGGSNAEALMLEAVPEPATMVLLGLAIAGLGGYLRRRRAA